MMRLLLKLLLTKIGFAYISFGLSLLLLSAAFDSMGRDMGGAIGGLFILMMLYFPAALLSLILGLLAHKQAKTAAKVIIFANLMLWAGTLIKLF